MFLMYSSSRRGRGDGNRAIDGMVGLNWPRSRLAADAFERSSTRIPLVRP